VSKSGDGNSDKKSDIITLMFEALSFGKKNLINFFASL
jgi:hypothetical protein